jgi:hypothetical protein
MLGLARAMASGAASSGGGRLRVHQLDAAPPRDEAPPLAARSEYPPAMPATL